ncbi:hypothetical protein E2C01_031202 [Portunus trituberculatus]|uniref:Uncharacterized protein n=1 Tax=Portunus trituberculatus TaxID=210409 RepID=A0A5B7ETV9_PORTR|nr:hypothetical protein [Portunus trituberculatus]
MVMAVIERSAFGCDIETKLCMSQGVLCVCMYVVVRKYKFRPAFHALVHPSLPLTSPARPALHHHLL